MWGHRCVTSIVIISLCLCVPNHHVVHLKDIHFIGPLYSTMLEKNLKRYLLLKNKQKMQNIPFLKGTGIKTYNYTHRPSSVSRIYHNTIMENYNLKVIWEPSPPYYRTVSFQNPHFTLSGRQPYKHPCTGCFLERGGKKE